jgi:nucleotidyltransferase substrate binding protein (TIGR01987 family)
MKNENRWKQRFANFEKAYRQFLKILEKDTTNDEIFRSALIQTFEFLFELSWKTMNDKLEYGGFVVKTPRETIKQALESNYISDGEMWINALEERNKLSHVYDESLSIEAEKLIRLSYTKIFKDLYEYFKKQL